ncbi:MAG: potassium channel protein, partial [Lachnospiraceae bacterium]|nr:potassium channel protein [Lachnospiraceae bacterium]
AVSALLTVGYGDIYPVTFWGQFFAIVIAFLGVGLVAIPTGIISAGFISKYTAVKTDDTHTGDDGKTEAIIKENKASSPKDVEELKELLGDIDLPDDVTLLVIKKDKK